MNQDHTITLSCDPNTNTIKPTNLEVSRTAATNHRHITSFAHRLIGRSSIGPSFGDCFINHILPKHYHLQLCMQLDPPLAKIIKHSHD